MLKKYSIISLLLIAYTIVLAHSIIPHHHHDEDHDTEQTASAHHHDDDHEDSDKDSGFSHSLGNYLHSGTTADIHQQTSSVQIVSPAIINTFFTVVNFELKPIELPPPLKRPNNDFFQKSYYYLSSTGFRAPPFDLV